MHTPEEPTDPASQPSGGQSGAAGPKRPLLPLSRILLFLLLALMIGAWVVDHQARRASQAAFETLQEALGDERTISSVKHDDVRRMVGRDPDDDGQADDVYEQYSWQGVPYKHTVYVVYWHAKVPTMKDVSLNQAPR